MKSVDDSVRTPAPIMGLYDRSMWASIQKGAMQLQCCEQCGKFQYPPAPVCSQCLSSDLTWQLLSGRGHILSWVVFHRTYLDAYPAPYNVIAVRLMEGPTMISNLESTPPSGNWIGAPVNLIYGTMPDGAVLPKFVLDPNSQA
jgi:uncharacterized OB-fold protein